MSEHPCSGAEIAISISDAPDLGKLGYPKREVERAAFAICGAIVRAGARVSYGGNIDPAGYTFKMFEFLARTYTVRPQARAPFVHYLAESVLRTSDFDNLVRLAHVGSGIVETRMLIGGRAAGTLLPLGAGMGMRPSDERHSIFPLESALELSLWLETQPRQSDAAALTFMREIATENCAARIVMGGKMGLLDTPMDRYSGSMPGIVEEALIALERNKPLVVLGAFGGAARDLAIALDLLSGEGRVPRRPQDPSYDEALQLVSEYSERIPDALRTELSTLATLDRTEELAQRIIALLERTRP